MSLTLSSGPATEPVTTAEAKTHLRVTDSNSDTYIDTLIATARLACERETNRAFITQTWVLRLDSFPDVIRLRKCPVISVSSIAYVDSNGDSQTLSSSLYQVDTSTEPARIIPAYGQTWPTTRSQINAVTVTFTCGYGGASSVPVAIKHAIKLLISHWFEVREPVVMGTIVASLPMSVQYLLDPYKFVQFDGEWQ